MPIAPVSSMLGSDLVGCEGRIADGLEGIGWLRGLDLNQRPPAHEAGELRLLHPATLSEGFYELSDTQTSSAA